MLQRSLGKRAPDAGSAKAAKPASAAAAASKSVKGKAGDKRPAAKKPAGTGPSHAKSDKRKSA
jgi:hypothetical protein